MIIHCAASELMVDVVSRLSPSLLGTAIRHCDEHKGWLPPNLFNCTSVTFTKLKTLVCIIKIYLLDIPNMCVHTHTHTGLITHTVHSQAVSFETFCSTQLKTEASLALVNAVLDALVV